MGLARHVFCIAVIAAQPALVAPASAQPIYADDPAAAIAIADWFRTLPAEAPPVPAAAEGLPPAVDIADTIAGRLAAEAARDVGPLAEGGGGGAAPPVLPALNCTLATVQAATEPFQAVLVGQIDDIEARHVALGGAAGTTAGLRALILDPLRRLPGQPPIVEPVTLGDAAQLDQLAGGQYWTIRWHERNAFRYAMTIANFAGVPIHGETGFAGRTLNNIAGGFGVADVPAAFQTYLAMREEVLEAAADWIAALRSMGCGSLADATHVRIAVMLSYDEEYQRLHELGVAYWSAFGFGAGHAQFPRTIVGYGYGNMFDPNNWFIQRIEAAMVTATEVATFLGPLPPAPEPPAIPAANGGTAGGDVATPARATPVPTVPPEIAVANNAGAPPANWDAPPDRNRTAFGAQPGGNDTPDNVTWITATGLGAWAQPDLTGFWRFIGDDDLALTHLRAAAAENRFEGWVVDNAEIAGRWVDMEREGETTGWRGEIYVALDGACPRWTPGVFIVEPSATLLNGAWAGPRVDRSNCAETNEPDGGAIQLERIVATVFQPIVPGKYIHLIGAPAVGPNPAQYSAAVEFACSTAGLPVAAVRVVAAEGRLVEMGPCRYQLVFDRPGGYDIAVELVGPGDEVLHVDRLRADIPAIPGLLQ